MKRNFILKIIIFFCSLAVHKPERNRGTSVADIRALYAICLAMFSNLTPQRHSYFIISTETSWQDVIIIQVEIYIYKNKN